MHLSIVKEELFVSYSKRSCANHDISSNVNSFTAPRQKRSRLEEFTSFNSLRMPESGRLSDTSFD